MFFKHLARDQCAVGDMAHLFQNSCVSRMAAMRWMTQKWIVSKKDETLWDILIDAMIALFGAVVVTQFIRSLVSIL
jgi:hypothetical protein